MKQEYFALKKKDPYVLEAKYGPYLPLQFTQEDQEKMVLAGFKKAKDQFDKNISQPVMIHHNSMNMTLLFHQLHLFCLSSRKMLL